MCVGIPARVIRLKDKKAVVKQHNHLHEIDLSFITETIQEGDYLLVHQDVAISKIPIEEAQKILSFTSGPQGSE